MRRLTRFRSGRFSRGSIYSCVVATLLAAPTIASGAITASSTNFGQTGGGFSFYALKTGSYGTAFEDTADPNFPFNFVDVTPTQASDAGERANELKFNVSSDKSNTIVVGTGQVLVLMVSVGPGGTNSVVAAGSIFIPISSINNTPCLSNGTQNCLIHGSEMLHGAGGVLDHYFAVPFTKGVVNTIGLYPRDVCTDYTLIAGVSVANGGKGQSGATATGCDTTTINVVTGNTTSMGLTFELRILDNINAIGPTGAVQDTGSLSLQYQNAGASFACPDLTNIYKPGDGQIIVDAQPFSLGGSIAPASQLLVVGREGATVALDSTFQSTDTIVARGALGGPVGVGGFVNSDETAHDYSVGFMMKDSAGLVYPDPSCQFSGVRTSQILGFLNKSNCFIATAAFRDVDAAPVAMLREFRDRILQASAPGRAFVRWYYRWSPPAAEWLMRHPALRWPVLAALVPIEALAWLCLNPMGITLLIFAALVGLAKFRLRERA